MVRLEDERFGLIFRLISEIQQLAGYVIWALAAGTEICFQKGRGVYSIISTKYNLNLLYFNAFFVQIFAHREKSVCVCVGGG